MGYVEEQGIGMNISLQSVGTPAVRCQRGLFYFMHRLYTTHGIHRTLTVMYWNMSPSVSYRRGNITDMLSEMRGYRLPENDPIENCGRYHIMTPDNGWASEMSTNFGELGLIIGSSNFFQIFVMTGTLWLGMLFTKNVWWMSARIQNIPSVVSFFLVSKIDLKSY